LLGNKDEFRRIKEEEKSEAILEENDIDQEQ